MDETGSKNGVSLDMRVRIFRRDLRVRLARAVRPCLQVEVMEQRRLLATFLVQSTVDDGSEGTLRWAITQANQDANPDTIGFAIQAAGVQLIRLTTPLPTITNPVSLDGTTQPGYAGKPLIELSGSDLAAGSDGLTLSAGQSAILGLSINGFSGSAIVLDGGDGNLVAANALGTDASGMIARPNGVGITIVGSSQNTIGGNFGQSSNLISGNLGNGIVIASAVGSSGNRIEGNLIGTDATGKSALPNRLNGILIDHASGNTIGGLLPGLGNLISGNGGRGIVIQATLGESTSNLIAGNRIGTTIDGVGALGNASDGIEISGALGTTIGGLTPAAGNVISGNKAHGLSLAAGATLTMIQGNLIGTRADGLAALGNSADGIHLVDAPSNTIGGIVPGSMNVISGNLGNGIYIGSNSDFQTIAGNAIGTDAFGVLNLGNQSNGVYVGSSLNMIGGLAPGAGNLIAFNGTGSIGAGVQLNSSAQQNSILSNSMFGNHRLGINLGGGPTPNDDQDTDSGGNGLQNYPVLIASQSDGQTTTVQGTLNSTPNTSLLLQFFSSPLADITGFGPGKFLVGSLHVTTDDEGNATFTAPGFTPAQGSFLTATATDPLGNTSEFSQAVSIQTVADLSVSILATPEPVHVGDLLVYTVTVTNNSAVIANGVSITNTLPGSVLFQSASTSQGTFWLSGSVFTASLGPIAGKASATLTIVVRPQQGALGTITHTAKVTSQSIDPDPTNNSTTIGSTVRAAADLSVSIMAKDASVPIQGPSTYTIIVRNQGPSTAHNVILHLPHDPSAAVVSVSPNSGMIIAPDGSLDLPLGSFLPGASLNLTLVVKALSMNGLSVAALVSSDEDDLDPSNNLATATTQVSPATDLSVSITANATTGYRGRDLTYTLVVSNLGPCDATGVNLKQNLPVGAVFVSANADSGIVPTMDAGALTAVIDTLQAGTSVSLTVIVHLEGDTPDAIVTTAQVSSGSPEIDPANDESSLQTSIVNASDLSVAVTANPTPAQVGDLVAFTITVTNQGPSNDPSVHVTDLLPPGLTFVSATSSQGDSPAFQAGKLLANLGALGAGQSATITLYVVPTFSVIEGLASTVTVSGSAVELDPSNNVLTSVLPVQPVNLAVSLTASNDAVQTGDSLTWTLAVRNVGPTPATGVRLDVPIPALMQVVSASSSAGSTAFHGGILTALIGGIEAGGVATVTLHLLAIQPGSVSSTATVTADEYNTDPNGGSASLSGLIHESPGIFQFSTTAEIVNASAGSATFTVIRSKGSAGTVSVHYQTLAGSAVAWRDYVPASGTLVFLPGQTSQSIVVPILDRPHTDSNYTVSLLLSGVTEGARLGTADSASLIIHDPDPDTMPPRVADVQLLGGTQSISGLLVSFTESIGGDTASDPRAFRLVDLGADGRIGTGDDQLIAIGGLSYDASRNTVMIVPMSPLPAGRYYGVEVTANGPGAIHDLAGNHLDGSGAGIAGTAYAALFARGSNLNYKDSQGNSVNLRLRGPGFIDQIRNANGDGISLNLGSVVSGKSTLTGSVKRGRIGTGSTEIGTIGGLGTFGQVRVKLASPSFIVRSYPFVSTSRNQPVASVPTRSKVLQAKPRPLVRLAKVRRLD